MHGLERGQVWFREGVFCVAVEPSAIALQDVAQEEPQIQILSVI